MYVYDSITEGRCPVCNYVFSSVRVVYRWDARKRHQAIPATNKTDSLLVFSRYILLIVTHTLVLPFLTRHSKLDDTMYRAEDNDVGDNRNESRGVKGGQLGIVDQLVFSFTPHFSEQSNYHWVCVCVCKTHDESSRTTRVRESRRVNPPSRWAEDTHKRFLRRLLTNLAVGKGQRFVQRSFAHYEKVVQYQTNDMWCDGQFSIRARCAPESRLKWTSDIFSMMIMQI